MMLNFLKPWLINFYTNKKRTLDNITKDPKTGKLKFKNPYDTRKEKARIRVQLSAAHTKLHLDKAIAAFIKVGKELKIIKN